MGYCFRIRFRLGNHIKLDTDVTELVLAGERDDDETVVLRQPVQGETLGQARQLVLRGGSYESEPAAQDAAERWRAYLQAALARLNVGADFGDRAPTGTFTEFGLQILSEEAGIRALNDVHGITVFECDPKPTFVAQDFDVMVGKPAHRLVEAVHAAQHIDLTRTPVEQLAYDLYSASFFQPSADARFVTLMMAMETLLVPQPRSDEVAHHVAALIAATEKSGLPRSEIQSVLDSMRWLYKESIGQAGRRLAHTLEPRRYRDETPPQFFTRCYELRSRLVHGSYPRPTRDEVDQRAAPLETFVADLLSGELLDLVPDWEPDEQRD